MEVVEKDGLLLSIAEHGYGKRTPLENYRLTSRGGKGVINMKTTNKTGRVVGILLMKEDSDVMIVSQNGKIIRQAGRSTQGVRLVNLEEGDKVAAASVLPEAEEPPADDTEMLPLQ
jgi:DNA gyrase subunit A